jgi:hypothetical protein
MLIMDSTLSEKYKQLFESDFEGAMNGKVIFDDWRYMTLVENLKPTIDYEMVGRAVWYS